MFRHASPDSPDYPTIAVSQLGGHSQQSVLPSTVSSSKTERGQKRGDVRHCRLYARRTATMATNDIILKSLDQSLSDPPPASSLHTVTRRPSNHRGSAASPLFRPKGPLVSPAQASGLGRPATRSIEGQRPGHSLPMRANYRTVGPSGLGLLRASWTRAAGPGYGICPARWA